MTMRDVLTSGVAFFQFAIVALIVVGISTALGGFSYFSNSFAFAQASQALTYMNYVGLFLIIGFFIISVGLAAYSINNKIFLPISILFLVIDVVLAAVFSDVFVSIVQSTAMFQNAGQVLNLMTLLASNMPVVIGVMGFSVIVATYTNIVGGGQRAAR